MDRIRVEIGHDFVPLVTADAPNLITAIGTLRATLEAGEEQMTLPAVRVCDSHELEPLGFRVLILGSQVASGTARDAATATGAMVAALKGAALEHREELVI